MGLQVEVNWEEIACIGIKDLKNYKVLLRQLATEFIGTYVYIFIGCCSIISHDWSMTELQASWIVFGLAFGLGAHCSVIFAGHISAHFNPAVTLGMFIIGECSILRGIPYILTQLLAGVCAVGTIVLISPADDTENSAYASCFIKMEPVAKGLIPEAIGVFILVLTMAVVLDTSRKDVKGSPALAIGMCIAAANMHCYYWTGASFNPARTMGTSLFSDMWSSTWLYWLGPVLGTSFAGLSYRFIFADSGFPPYDPRTKEEKKKDKEEQKRKQEELKIKQAEKKERAAKKKEEAKEAKKKDGEKKKEEKPKQEKQKKEEKPKEDKQKKENPPKAVKPDVGVKKKK